MIEFHCPHCEKLLRTADDKAGLRANCPGCGETVAVPESSTTAESDAPTGRDVFEGEPDASAPPPVPRKATVSSAGGRPGGTTPCPMCGEQIARNAIRCKHCGEEVEPRSRARDRTIAHRGVLVLVFGIIGLMCCFPFGIAAWVMGHQDLREIDAGRMDESGRGLTMAGKILGIIACAWTALITVIYAVGFIVAAVNQQNGF